MVHKMGFESEFYLMNHKGQLLQDKEKVKQMCRGIPLYSLHGEWLEQFEACSKVLTTKEELVQTARTMMHKLEDAFAAYGYQTCAVCDRSSQHIHIGCTAPLEQKINAYHGFFEFIPGLVQLMCNSPYIEGKRSAYKSSRVGINAWIYTQYPGLVEVPSFTYSKEHGDGRELLDFEIRQRKSTFEIRLPDTVMDADYIVERVLLVRGLVRRALKNTQRITSTRWKHIAKARLIAAKYGLEAVIPHCVTPQQLITIACEEDETLTQADFPLMQEMIEKNSTFADIGLSIASDELTSADRLVLQERYTARKFPILTARTVDVDSEINQMVLAAVRDATESSEIMDIRDAVGLPLVVLDECVRTLEACGELQKRCIDKVEDRYIYVHKGAQVSKRLQDKVANIKKRVFTKGGLKARFYPPEIIQLFRAGKLECVDEKRYVLKA